MNERVEIYRVGPQTDEPLRGEAYAVPNVDDLVEQLREEITGLRDRIAELERENAELRR